MKRAARHLRLASATDAPIVKPEQRLAELFAAEAVLLRQLANVAGDLQQARVAFTKKHRLLVQPHMTTLRARFSPKPGGDE